MNVVKSSRISSRNLPKPDVAPKVNLYQQFPTLEVSLDDFEEFALDRQKVCIALRYFVGV